MAWSARRPRAAPSTAANSPMETIISNFILAKVRIAPEDFVAVHFKTKRSTCLYLAKVLEDVEDEFLLKFLPATRSDGVYNWPMKDDVSWQRKHHLWTVISDAMDFIHKHGIEVIQFLQNEFPVVHPAMAW
ncbi:hypothetical protein MAR_020461 [Mya arenaria]|uniref:Uncharacterized protein n=1 Tax=Mya arenaria TaxID=6604 RepID=A0ABY7E503_MYAAR|nr:hypothetical protein MAR_020461 [Mya arenaria]